MTDDERRRHAGAKQPLSTRPRPQMTPVLVAAGLVMLIVVVFLLSTVLGYHG